MEPHIFSNSNNIFNNNYIFNNSNKDIHNSFNLGASQSILFRSLWVMNALSHAVQLTLSLSLSRIFFFCKTRKEKFCFSFERNKLFCQSYFILFRNSRFCNNKKNGGKGSKPGLRKDRVLRLSEKVQRTVFLSVWEWAHSQLGTRN